MNFYVIKTIVVAACACAILIGILISHQEPPACTKIAGTFIIAGRC